MFRATLKRSWVCFAIEALLAALLVGLVLRYSVGYIPKFFKVSFPFATIAFLLSIAVALVQRTGRSIGDVALATATVVSLSILSVFLTPELSPIKPPAPVAVPSPPPVVSARAIYNRDLNADTRVVSHSLPGGDKIFLRGVDKRPLKSLEDLARLALKYEQRWSLSLRRQGFSAGEAKAVGLMLFTSALWAYGNDAHPDKPGCVTANEDNGWHYEPPTVEVIKKAGIGCCTDYAYALSFILSKHGFHNRLVNLPWHILNEVRIEGRWYVLDANTNIFIEGEWNGLRAVDGQMLVHVFPHPGAMPGALYRPLLHPFQTFLVNLIRFGESPDGIINDGFTPDPQYAQTIHQLY